MTYGQNRATPKPLDIVSAPYRVKTLQKYDWVRTTTGITGSVRTIEYNPDGGGLWVKIVKIEKTVLAVHWVKWEDCELSYD